jgi:putative phosphonate metabolism protein
VTTSTSTARYALFFAPPPESALWRFGSAVLGYDAVAGSGVAQVVPPSVSPDAWWALTDEPRRYGFHATLKAPFRIAASAEEADLLAAVRVFTRNTTPFDLALEVSQLDAFVALTPVAVPPAVTGLERAIVETFDRFRAPLNERELARRLTIPLTPRQRAQLDQYGYPYVLDEFRFHMTLSGRLPAELQTPVLAFLAEQFRAHCQPSVAVDRLAVFRETDGRFRILESVPFG